MSYLPSGRRGYLHQVQAGTVDSRVWGCVGVFQSYQPLNVAPKRLKLYKFVSSDIDPISDKRVLYVKEVLAHLM